jgi:hypothetical protein
VKFAAYIICLGGVALPALLSGCAGTKPEPVLVQLEIHDFQSTNICHVTTFSAANPNGKACVPVVVLNAAAPASQKQKSWVDVTDTAITIGLSALIGGGFGVLGAWLSFRREADKEYLKRKRELLESILDQFDKFAQQQSAYWANLANAAYLRDKNDPAEPLTDETKAKLKKGQDELWESYLLLIPAGSKLHLVGEPGAVAALKAARDESDAFFKKADVDNPHCTKDFIDQSKEKLTAARKKFYDSLHAAYSRKSS